MPIPIRPEEWRLVGIDDLESTAWDVLRSQSHEAVLAGPGAGKTELLAQRACYLLQTALCPPPKRILAISFKRDAAKNLHDRVEKRCGPELARRFDSYTFDAFAKGLLDRFRLGLPQAWRPKHDYLIATYSDRELRSFLASFDDPSLRSLNTRDFRRIDFPGDLLPIAQSTSPRTQAAIELWRRSLQGTPSRLEFPMIGRLAELMLRCNPLILQALRLTYAYVFLDEFQDTTAVQYCLTKIAFHGSDAALTAVGDDKQRIMGWAGALPNAFDGFCSLFGTTTRHLAMNYRSAPELVRIQQFLIQSLDPTSPAPRAHSDGSRGMGECCVYAFPSHEKEAEFIAALIAERLKTGLNCRDVCVLVKQRPALYAAALIEKMDELQIKGRDEALFQDLLTEPLTSALLIFLRLATSSRSGGVWGEAVDLVCAARNIIAEDDQRVRAVERLTSQYCRALREAMNDGVQSKEDLRNLLSETIRFVGEPAFKLEHPQYRQGGFYDSVLTDCASRLWGSFLKTKSWPAAIDDFQGADSVPIMTVHKSKGLEYDTIIFVGLEDSAFFSFRTQADEDRRAFFVAFSRAKQRVYFTFSRVRELNRGHEVQSRQQIGELYGLLQQAGVPIENVQG